MGEANKLVHVPDESRIPIIRALATMDDEAFSWFARAVPQSAMMFGGACQIWPDGVGGFMDKRKIEEIREAVAVWLASRSG